MKAIECWRLESKDLDYPNDLVARFTTRKEAEAASSEAGGYGPVIEKEVIEIWETALEWRPGKFDKDAITSGLAKLTDRERTALGLEP